MDTEGKGMDITFDWGQRGGELEAYWGDVEATIRGDIEGRSDDEFKPCHPGGLTVHLSIVGPLLTDLIGNITCSCGKPFCKFHGPSDASSVAYESRK